MLYPTKQRASPLVPVSFSCNVGCKETDMQPIAATRLVTYAVRFPRMSALELAKLTGERPASVREALAHLGRQ